MLPEDHTELGLENNDDDFRKGGHGNHSRAEEGTKCWPLFVVLQQVTEVGWLQR